MAPKSKAAAPVATNNLVDRLFPPWNDATALGDKVDGVWLLPDCKGLACMHLLVTGE